MPLTSEDLARAEWLRLLVLGYPKCGKSTSVLLTCEKPVYIINCDTDSGLAPARRKGVKFIYDNVVNLAQMEKAIASARGLVASGEVKTVLWDGMSSHARHIREELEAQSAAKNDSGKADGRKYWDELCRRLMNTAERLLALKCHVIVTSHYTQVSAEIDGQIKKAGDGVVPLIQGSARNQLPGLFDDIVFLEKTGDDRVFVLKSGGKFGPGGRSRDDVDSIDADIAQFWELCRSEDETSTSPETSSGAETPAKTGAPMVGAAKTAGNGSKK